MKLTNLHTQVVAALKVGIDPKTARKYIKKSKLPSECKELRDWRTRVDEFASVWPTLEAMLKNGPGLEAKTLLEWLIERGGEPGFHWGQLRTLQRKVRKWRAMQGDKHDVIFPQIIQPGRQSQSDYTCMNAVGIHIAGERFLHLLFHFMLPYSRWENVMICQTESFESLVAGYTKAVWALGGVVPEHRTDNLSAATHRVESGREFNESWREFLTHYHVKPSRNNPGEANENGSVEKSHDLFKKHVVQQLLLRGSTHFSSLEDYQAFLQNIVQKRNAGRKQRLAEEMEYLLPLPIHPWQAVRTFSVTVSPSSTISVLKGIYSVPSRLIGYRLDVNVYVDYLELRYGNQVVETLPRLSGDSGASINYRHIISSLLRKPGAFAHYQYREHLFPRVIFRKAYDALVEHSPTGGHKQYLKVLQLAAITCEGEVATALEVLLEADQLPLPESLKTLLDLPCNVPPKVNVDPPTLGDYDELLHVFAVQHQEVQHVSY